MKRALGSGYNFCVLLPKKRKFILFNQTLKLCGYESRNAWFEHCLEQLEEEYARATRGANR